MRRRCKQKAHRNKPSHTHAHTRGNNNASCVYDRHGIYFRQFSYPSGHIYFICMLPYTNAMHDTSMAPNVLWERCSIVLYRCVSSLSLSPLHFRSDLNFSFYSSFVRASCHKTLGLQSQWLPFRLRVYFKIISNACGADGVCACVSAYVRRLFI